MNGFDDFDNVPTYTHLKPVNNDRQASETGWKVREPLQDNADIDISYKTRRPNLNHELAVDIHNGLGGARVIAEARRKMDEIGDLDITDFMDAKVSPDVKRAFAESMKRQRPRSSASTPSQNYDNPFDDSETSSGGRFVVEKAMAALKSGAKIPVWMIVDSNNGQQFQKPFKIHEAAIAVSNLLNEHGTIKHPSVKKALTAYDTYNEILKKVNIVKKAINEGEEEQRPVLTRLREQLKTCGKAIGL